MSNANKNHKPGDGSTGPTTQAGKLRSSCNATAHGARSERHIILPNESAEDYEKIRTNWLEDFPPITDGDQDMVERVAETHWRLIRCERLLNDAEAEAFAIDLKPRNWPAEERKYVELMMRYRTTADRAFRSARRDMETVRRTRLELMYLEEKTKMAMLRSRQAGIKDPYELPDDEPDASATPDIPAANKNSIDDETSPRSGNASQRPLSSIFPANDQRRR